MNDIVNPLQNTSYTNKDFVSVYTELLDLVKQLTSKWDPSISNESDPGVVLLKLNALIADKCNYAIDKNVLECFPLSVTQETNARHLFEQLGYYMHWYKSATTQVALTWIGDDQYASASGYYIIPAFTMVTDADASVIYTLIGPYEGTTTDTFIVGDVQLPCTGSNRTIRMKAIQGVAIDYTIGGSVLITPDKLDENNRLYFDNNNIAQNGIFITNVNRNNYSQWIQKDNLLIENIGNTYYTFGVTDDGANCYLQFPDDVYNLFEDGITIKYIKTDDVYGNISANVLSKFHADFTAYDENGDVQLSVNDQQIAMSSDVIKLTNPLVANNGLDKENINEAYKGYKSTVGTFETLVTLRDYINAIKKSGLVSNCFVCDRTNDIQTTYKLVPAVSDSDTLISVSEADNALDAFTLKLYATQYVLKPQTKLEFNNSFYMLANNAQNNIKTYIDNEKTILHDFGNLITPNEDFSHICYFKNKYPIECTIIPQSNLSNLQKKVILNNIKLALYENLNASQVEFGDEISYQYVYDVIKNADNRISAISLNTIGYETYAVYYVENTEIHYSASDNTWYDDEGNEYNPNDYLIYPSDVHDGATEVIPPHFREILISTEDDNPINVNRNNDTYELTVDEDVYMLAIGVDNWYDYQTFTVQTATPHCKWINQANNAEQYENADFITTYGIEIPLSTDLVPNLQLLIQYSASANDGPDVSCTKSDGTTVTTEVTPETLLSALGVNNESHTITFKYVPVDYNYDWTLNDSPTIIDINDYGISIEEAINSYTHQLMPLQQNDYIKIKVSLKTQMRNEIYTKSVLAGKTQFFIQDETFDYKLNQIYDAIVDNVEYISTNVDIEFNQFWNGETDEDNNKTVYTLKDNEYLQFYCPNLLDSTSYSTYVKMEYILNRDINADTNFELQPGEFIIFYWRTSTDEDGSLYDYAIYGPNNIFNTTFAIQHFTDVSKIVGYNLIERDNLGNILDTDLVGASKMTVDISDAVAEISNPRNILSGTKTLTRKELSQINIEADMGYQMYWIVDTIVGNSYRLFEALPQYKTGVGYEIGDMFTHNSIIYQANSTITVLQNINFDAISDYISQTVQSRVLNQGEYFIYTDSSQVNMSILGAGTKITRNVADFNWDVTIVDTTDITTNGIGTFYDEENDTSFWFTNLDTATMSLIQNQFVTLSPTQMVKITPKNLDDVYTLTHSVTSGTSFSDSDLNINTSLLYSNIQPSLTGASQNYIVTYDTSTPIPMWYLKYEQAGSAISRSIDNIFTFGISIERLKVNYDASATLSIQNGVYEFVYVSGTTWKYKYTANGETWSSETNISESSISSTYKMTFSGTKVAGDKVEYAYVVGAITPTITIVQKFNNGDTINLTISNSWQILIDSKGYTINVGTGQHNSDVSLSDFNIEYRQTNSTEFISLPDVSLQSATGWEVYSLLALNINNVSSQRLGTNQSFTYTTTNNTTATITGFEIMSSTAINNYGGTKINVSDLDEDGNLIYPSLYIFNDVNHYDNGSLVNPRVVYTVDGGAIFQFPGEASSELAISLALPVGNYILPLRHQYEGIDSITVQSTGITQIGTITTTITNGVFNIVDENKFITLYPTVGSYVFTYVDNQWVYDGQPVTLYNLGLELVQGTPASNSTFTVTVINAYLHNMGDPTLTNFATPSAYYLYLPIKSDSIFQLIVKIEGHNKATNIKLDNCYKYVKPDNISDNQFEIIQDLIFKLSNNLKFKYTYIVDPTLNIQNPLDPFQFLNANHIYNKNTICQLNNYEVTWG